MIATIFGKKAAFCAGLAAAWLCVAPAAAAAECGTLATLMDEFSQVHKAYEVLSRAAVGGAAAEAGNARALVSGFDRLIAARGCYIDRVADARRHAASVGGAGVLPTLREQKAALESFMERLPEDFTAGRDMLLSIVQSINIGLARGADAPAPRSEALAELLLHAETTARIAFAHVEIARARLLSEVLGQRAGDEAREALAVLEDFVPRVLEYNGLIVGNPLLERRFADTGGGFAGVVMARGEYALDGAAFDRERHCRLAAFKASEALDALAARLGVVARAAEPGGCEHRDGMAVAWRSVPEEALIRVRDWR